MKIDQTHLAALATRMSTSSAMNPGLLLCLMVCPLAFIIAGSLFHGDNAVAASLFVVIGIFPLLIAGWQLVHFTLKEPNRLQREQHIERMTEIQNRLSVRDGDKVVEVQVSNELASNPQIEDGR